MTKQEEILLQWQDRRTQALSRMLDNPDSNGIYPTTTFFTTIDTDFKELSQKVAIEFAEWRDRIKSMDEHYYFNSGLKLEYTTEQLFNLFIQDNK